MSFSVIFNYSWRFFKEKFKEIILITLPFFLNWFLVNLFLISILRLSPFSYIFLGILMVVWFFLVNSFFELIILNLIKHPSFSLKEIFKKAITKIFPYLLLKILLGLIIFLSFLAFIIPGIIFSVYLYFSIYCFVDQDLRIIQAIKKSWQLVKSRWWKVFKIILVFSLIGLLIVFLVGVLCAFFKNNLILKAFSDFLTYLFFIPFSFIFFYHFYLLLKGNDKEELELTQ